jgi:hypothetical protein
MTVIHFSGQFEFQMPVRNNVPELQYEPFDPEKDLDDVMDLCGCNPSKYFEFKFNNAQINQITYANGDDTSTADPLVGKLVDLNGLLVDVSPSAICAQLFAGKLNISNNLRGKINTPSQSHLRHNIRTRKFDDFSASAHFDTTMITEFIDNPLSSKCLKEISNHDLELYFHLNNFTSVGTEPKERQLEGDVYGYIRTRKSLNEDNGIRIKNRRLVESSALTPDDEIGKTYLFSYYPTINRNLEINGSFDISDDKKLLYLRYMEFVPFLDRNYTTPNIHKYSVYFRDFQSDKDILVGEFDGNHQEMKLCGGLKVFKLPDNFAYPESFLLVNVIKDSKEYSLMVESEWDIILEEQRGIKIPSDETKKVVAKIYFNNRPAIGNPVNLYWQDNNDRSPIVATFTKSCEYTDNDGKIEVDVKAIDLNNTGGIFDPVDKINYDKLPMDRNYGNFVYMSIPNPLRRTNPAVEEIEIPVRVLHKVNPDLISVNEISFEKHIFPLFSYHRRYYSWLHCREHGGKFMQFFDISDYASFSLNVDNIIYRLSRDDDNYLKMPRSRDFPYGGLDLIKRWKEAGMPK